MGMFSWIRRLTTRPAHLRLDGPGDFDFEIVGEASYQDALEALAGGGTDDGHSRVLVRPAWSTRTGTHMTTRRSALT